MSHSDGRADGTDAAQVLTEELLRTGLGDVLGLLLEDMPDDAFPGEDPISIDLSRRDVCYGRCGRGYPSRWSWPATLGR